MFKIFFVRECGWLESFWVKHIRYRKAYREAMKSFAKDNE